MSSSGEILGWALSTLTITVNPNIEIDIHTEQRSYLAHDTCIKEHNLNLLTGKRETNGDGWRKIEMCTPVLKENLLDD